MAVDASAITAMGHSSVRLQCNLKWFLYYRGVEQLAARRAHNPEVAGSSPASAIVMAVEVLAITDMIHLDVSPQCDLIEVE